ncbi:MAG: creatininase family protein [Planctomycetes bacterium]|nr:creatininase family protein [Planctomycetota bacterium]MCC7169286.1 creatininase family protein [Planctomycetota bacterium]
MTRALDLARATTTDVDAIAPQVRAALLPLGSTEAHGPHLPLSTDVIIATTTATRAAARLTRAGVGTLVLPAIPYAVTEFLKPFRGTISVRAQTIGALIDEIADSVFAQGVRVLALVNGHLEPEHGRMLKECARRITATGRGIAVFPDQRRPPTVAQLGEEFGRGGGHAGGFETSLVLAAAPELVKDERRSLAANFADLAQRMKDGAADAIAAGGARAYFGDPAGATAEEGDRLYDVMATMVSDAVVAALAAGA